MTNKERIHNIQKVRNLVWEACSLFDGTVIGTCMENCEVGNAFSILLNESSPWEQGLNEVEKTFYMMSEGINNE